MKILVSGISYEDMKFVWVKNHWDVHLEGLCTFSNELCFFRIDNNYDDSDLSKPFFYDIYELSFIEKLKWLLRKKLFEICVGYHWTYKNGKRGPAFRGISWKSDLYYSVKKFFKIK